MFLSVSCKRDSNPRFATIHPSRNSTRQQQVAGALVVFSSLDICRHYIAKSVIKDNLDLMEMNKFNVFHWHMTDDPSFPYVSTKFPNLRWFACRKRIHVRNIGKSKPPSKMGSFDEKLGVYTQQDVAEIIEYYNY